jgi:hypothetical protein
VFGAYELQLSRDGNFVANSRGINLWWAKQCRWGDGMRKWGWGCQHQLVESNNKVESISSIIHARYTICWDNNSQEMWEEKSWSMSHCFLPLQHVSLGVIKMPENR